MAVEQINEDWVRFDLMINRRHYPFLDDETSDYEI